jgi:poly-gamma-glutamate synthase PgsB/CapB
MLLVFLLAAAFLIYGIVEYRIHVANLMAVPIRIHVNGTRGKSSVTRLIAAGLRAGGLRTVAKTTGSAARYIHPDGSEEPVSRPGPPNIREQLAVVRQARSERAQAIVLECMAIRPDLQWLCEHRIVRSTIGVITNARPDHLDEMGPTVEHVALSLAGTVPRDKILFTAEHDQIRPIAETARSRGTELREILPEAADANLAQGFRYVEHLENVAVALAVCEHLGVPTDVAVKGMRGATPDPGALFVYNLIEDEKEIQFVSAFAANDRDSTVAIWNALNPNSDPDRTVIVIASMRADRPDRVFQFGRIIADDLPADHYVLTGGMTHPVRSIAISRGLEPERIHDLGGRDAEDVLSKVIELSDRRAIVVGVGNIGGAGSKILSLFRERSERH